MEYRPQSPKFTSYHPQSPDLSGLRPPSPELAGLPSPGFGATLLQQPHHHQQYPPHQRGRFGGSYDRDRFPGAASLQPTPLSTTSHPPTSAPPQPSLDQPVMARSKIEQDDGYLPDAPTKRPRRNLQSKKPGNSNGESEVSHLNTPPQSMEMEGSDPTLGVQLKTSFPVARIKRIMQADEDIGKVAQVTPHVVSRALELFMIKLISASAAQATGGSAAKGPKRIQAQHLKRAIFADEQLDFLRPAAAKVPDAPAKAKKEAGSDSEDVKPKKKAKKRKDSVDDF